MYNGRDDGILIFFFIEKLNLKSKSRMRIIKEKKLTVLITTGLLVPKPQTLVKKHIVKVFRVMIAFPVSTLYFRYRARDELRFHEHQHREY